MTTNPINSIIANSLGMSMPEIPEGETVPVSHLVEVLPTEVEARRVNNPDLPDMSDMEKAQIEAEVQLERVIALSMHQASEMAKKTVDMEPRFLARTVEVTNDSLKVALDAIKTKLDNAREVEKARMEKVNFKREGAPGGAPDQQTTNNFFFHGSREELLAALESKLNPEEN